MHKRTCMKSNLLLALASLAAVSACSGSSNDDEDAPSGPAPAQTITEAEASNAANEIVGLFADDGADKAQFIAKSKTFDEMSGSSPDCAPTTVKPGEEPTPAGECKNEEFDADQVAKDIKDWFSDHLFNAKLKDNKLTTDKMVVYCLAAEDICDDGDDIAQPGEPITTGSGSGSGGSDGKSDDVGGNDACIKGVKDVPVCVAVSKHGDKDLSGKVLVGYKPQVVPITFTMKANKLTLDADVAKLLEAAKMVTKAIGEELPEEFPQVVTGLVGAELLRGADKKITGSLAIKQAVHVSAFDKTHKKFYDVTVAQTASALKVVLGQADHTVLVAAGLEAIDIGLAADMLFGESSSVCVSDGGSTGEAAPPPGDGDKDPTPPGEGEGKEAPPGGPCGAPEPATPKDGAFFASIGGGSFQVELNVDLDKEIDTISVVGLGLGSKTTTISYFDGKATHKLAAFDLNKAATPPRKLDVKATYDGDKIELIVVPQFDAVLSHTLATVAKLFDDDMPKFLLKGNSQVTFDGKGKPTLEFKPNENSSSKTSVPVPAPDPGDGGGDNDDGDPPYGEEEESNSWPWIKVLDGLLTLKAWGLDGMADVTVEVKAGSCVVEAEKNSQKEGEESHIFGRLTGGPCAAPSSNTPTPLPTPAP